jgi:hypothetical protein
LVGDMAKTLRTKSSNHIFRAVMELSTGKNGEKRYKVRNEEVRGIFQAIEEVVSSHGPEFFLETECRAASFQVFLRCSKNKSKQALIKRLVERMDPERDLTSFHSFVYDEVCRSASEKNLERLFGKIRGHIPALSGDSFGNYFMQHFIDAFPRPREIFGEIRGDLENYSFNNNVVYRLVEKMIQQREVEGVEAVLRAIYMREGEKGFVEKLLFHGDGVSFNTKYTKLVCSLIPLPSKFQRAIHLEAVSLFESKWLFLREGRKVVHALFAGGVDAEILSIFAEGIKGHFGKMSRSEEGMELLRAVGKWAGKETRRMAEAILRRHKQEEGRCLGGR